MRIVKIVFWIILIGLFGLIVYQNQSFFLSTQDSLAVHFGSKAYQSAQLPLVVFFAFFFLLGWLIAYLFGLIERYKVGRANKLLRNDIATQQTELASLKKELETIRASLRSSNVAPPPDTAELSTQAAPGTNGPA